MGLHYRCCRFACRAAFLSLFRGRAFGRHHVPDRGGVLLVCNHQSFLDPIMAGVPIQRECHFMARATLFAQPAFARLIRSVNAFPVKRGEADLGAIKQTLRLLKQGHIVIVFPEGTRSPDGRVQPMRSGVILIARKARVPIVPTLILGTYQAWPRQRKLPHAAPVLIAYDRPLAASEIAQGAPEAAIERVRLRIAGLMDRYRSHPMFQAHPA